MASSCKHLRVRFTDEAVTRNSAGKRYEWSGVCLRCNAVVAPKPDKYPQLTRDALIGAILDKSKRPELADAIGTLDSLSLAAKHALDYRVFANELQRVAQDIIEQRGVRVAYHVSAALTFDDADAECATEALLAFWKEYHRKRDEG